MTAMAMSGSSSTIQWHAVAAITDLVFKLASSFIASLHPAAAPANVKN